MNDADEKAPSLRTLQERLAAAILEPRSPETEALLRWIAPVEPDAARERLGAHSGGYPVRILEAVRETYPAIAHLLGDRTLAELAERYVAAEPPRAWDLGAAGARFPEFLRGDPLTRELPFLPDLATLERAVMHAFHAEAHPPVEPAQLLGRSAEAWECTRLRLQPSCALVRSAWPIRDLWAARGTPREKIDVDLVDRPDHVLVRRAALEVVCESVSAGEADALEAVVAGRCLSEIVEELGRAGHAPAEAARWFARWLLHGLVISCGPE